MPGRDLGQSLPGRRTTRSNANQTVSKAPARPRFSLTQDRSWPGARRHRSLRSRPSPVVSWVPAFRGGHLVMVRELHESNGGVWPPPRPHRTACGGRADLTADAVRLQRVHRERAVSARAICVVATLRRWYIADRLEKLLDNDHAW